MLNATATSIKYFVYSFSDLFQYQKVIHSNN